MNALRVLRRFILIKSAEGKAEEIRGYVLEQLLRFAEAFHVEPRTLLDALGSVEDDELLATKLLETIMKAEGILREQRRDERSRAAQASANAIASMAFWTGDRIMIDMPSLVASVLTRRDDLLVFSVEDGFTVGVYMAPLLDLAKIARAREDLHGWVDKNGLHLRWRTGGLNLRSQEDKEANRIILPLPPMPSVVAA